MSEIEIIIDTDETSEGTNTEEPTTVELVNDAIDHIVDEVTSEANHGANVDMVVGMLVTGLEALTSKIDALESRLIGTETVAEIALDTADSAVAIVAEAAEDVAIETAEVVDDVAEEVAEELSEPDSDEFPPRKRDRFSRWWFGE